MSTANWRCSNVRGNLYSEITHEAEYKILEKDVGFNSQKKSPLPLIQK